MDEFVLAVLNTTPTVKGRPQDHLRDGVDGASPCDLATGWGGSGTPAEVRVLQWSRDEVQHVIRTGSTSSELTAGLREAVQRPRLTAGGLRWQSDGPTESMLALEFLMAWTDLVARAPGRLRGCENTECSLYFLDRSRGNAGRWCSMATCGNRMKARRHHERSHQADQTSS